MKGKKVSKKFNSLTDAEKLKIAVEALETIANPIGHLKNNLKEGKTLDGELAIMLDESPIFLKSVANQALGDIRGYDL